MTMGFLSSHLDFEISVPAQAAWHGAALPVARETSRGRKKRPVSHPESYAESLYGESPEFPKTGHEPFTEGLLRSHAELCAALRLAGRQILRLEGDKESLNRIRVALKNAEQLRKSWRTVDQPEAPAAAAPEELNSEPVVAAAGELPTPSRVRAARLSRPRLYRVLTFPNDRSR
jgi:hypothetical protein